MVQATQTPGNDSTQSTSASEDINSMCEAFPDRCNDSGEWIG